MTVWTIYLLFVMGTTHRTVEIHGVEATTQVACLALALQTAPSQIREGEKFQSVECLEGDEA